MWGSFIPYSIPVYPGVFGLSPIFRGYTSITEAYGKSLEGQEILVKADFYPEDLVFDLPCGIVLSSGWNLEFSDNAGGQSVIDGSLTITNGGVTIAGVIVIE